MLNLFQSEKCPTFTVNHRFYSFYFCSRCSCAPLRLYAEFATLHPASLASPRPPSLLVSMVRAHGNWSCGIDKFELSPGVINPNETRSCPRGEVCSSSANICGPPSLLLSPDCPSSGIPCGVCDDICRFACLNANTFAYCFGLTNYSSATGTCPTGTYCDLTVSAPQFCSSNAAVIIPNNEFIYKSDENSNVQEHLLVASSDDIASSDDDC